VNNSITAAEISNALGGRRSGNGFIAACPAHDDNSPSLSISDGINAKIIVKCHAGCDSAHVIDALKARNLWPQKTIEQNPKKKTEYVYADLSGAPALKVTRLDENGKKSFFQQHMENGQWSRGGFKEALRPYRFSEWKEQPTTRTLFLVEGEKAADAMFAAGFIATTTPGGSKGWKNSFVQSFKDRYVIILPDNDQPGREYAAAAYRDLQGQTNSVSILELPGLPEKGDAHDWFASGKSRDELIEYTERPPAMSDQMKDLLNNTASLETSASREYWPDPKPLKRSEDALQTLTEDETRSILPKLFADYVLDVAARLSVRPEFVAAPLLSIIGGIVGRRVAVRPKKHDTWMIFPCCLWGCISAPPGSRKSPILGEVRRFVDLLDDAAADEYADNRKHADSKLQALEQKKIITKKRMAKAYEEGASPDEIARLEIDLTTIATDAAAITPKHRRFMTSDSTSAKLAEIMADNPGGLIVFRDELEGLIQSFEQMGNEGLRAFYLEAWDGKGRITQDRVAAGTRRAKGIAATLLGSTQPDKLNRIASESNDGLIQRFGLLVCMPPQEFSDSDLEPNIEAFERLSQFCQSVSRMDGEKPMEMKLTDEARQIFQQWQKENAKLVAHPHSPPALQHHLNKYPALLCGLAGLFQLALTFEQFGSFGSPEVTQEALSMAAEWVESIFLPHARFVYAKNPAESAAEKLLNRIRSGQIHDGMKVRAIERKCWEGLNSSQILRQGLEELEDRAWIRLEEIKPATGRSSTIVRINPVLTEAKHA
jgi:hypothetical protein